MKTFALILLLLSISFTGCYTILWTIDDDLPSQDAYGNSYDIYYSDPYYGGYSYYYEYPWWIGFSPLPVSREESATNRSEEIRNARNNSGERNSSVERIAPPTRSSGSNTGSSNTDSNNSSQQSEVRSRSDNSTNSGSSSSDSRSQTRNSGSRNSGNGRR